MAAKLNHPMLRAACPVALLCATAIAAMGCRTRPRAEPDAAPVAIDAGKDAAVAEPAEPEPPPGPPKRIFAKKFVVKVRKAPHKEAFRIGYMRGGAVLMAKTDRPVGYDKCRKGWYELETGGFVCSTVDVIPFLGRRLPERRARQPDRTTQLPYPYGYSRRRNTPVYRRLPTDEEAAVYEGYRIPGVAPQDAGADAGPGLAPQIAGAAAEGDDEGEEPVDAGVPTLESLQGAEDTVLQRRMERGFYVSLDREMKRGRRRYWRTQANGFIPQRALLEVKGSTFEGFEIPDGEVMLPSGYVMSSKYRAYKLNKHGRLRPAGKPGYHHRFRIMSETTIGERDYVVDEGGLHYRADQIARIDFRMRPEGIGDDEKWIDVDLGHQSLVAYIGYRPVYATLVSTGRIKDELDPLKNFETPTGEFRISSKHLTATMDGDHAIDGPYSIEDVPYVMYFQLAYALHSAFWHSSFGRPRSHGCINLAPLDARWVFNFTTPELPAKWHGVYPTEEVPGTRLYIHGQTPEG